MRTVPSAVGHLKAADTADRQGDDAVREERKETAENTGCVLHGRGGILRKIHRDECLQKKQDAECPKCGTDMLVIPHVLEGISKDSSGIVKSVIRGI